MTERLEIGGVFALALVLALLGASQAHARVLSVHRAKAAIEAYWAPVRVLSVDSCYRRGPGRVACWAHGSGDPGTLSVSGARIIGWDWETVVTLHRDGRVRTRGENLRRVR